MPQLGDNSWDMLANYYPLITCYSFENTCLALYPAVAAIL